MKQLNPLERFLIRCLISSSVLEETVFKIKEPSLGGSRFLTSVTCACTFPLRSTGLRKESSSPLRKVSAKLSCSQLAIHRSAGEPIREQEDEGGFLEGKWGNVLETFLCKSNSGCAGSSEPPVPESSDQIMQEMI